MDLQKIERSFKIQHYVIATLLIFGITLLLYYPSLKYYFFQDDWFVFNWVKSNNLLSFFQFRTDIIYWRPISIPIFFWINKVIFNLNPLGFHLETFIFHLANAFLLGYIILILFKSRISAVVISLLYSTASFNFMSLSWLSLSWNHIGNFFLLLSLFFFIKPDKEDRLFIVLSLILFILALASTEFAIVFPVFIIFIELFRNNFNLLKSLERNVILLVATILLITVYLFIRFILFPIPSEGEYAIVVDSKVFNNFFWYLMWLVNIPEVLKYHLQISNLSFSNDPTFLNPFKPFLIPITIFFVVFITSFVLLFSRSLANNIFKALSAALILIFFSLLPVIFLPSHSFPYYLSIASLGFFIFLGYLLSDVLKKKASLLSLLLALLLVLSWILTSYLNLSFTRKTHWISGEQSISRKFIEEAKIEYGSQSKIHTIVIDNSDAQIRQSLMDQNAIKVIYNNDDIKTVYK